MSFFDHYSVIEPLAISQSFDQYVNKRDLKLMLTLLDTELRKHPILEVGPGRSTFAKECLRQGYDYIAVEPNAKLAQKLIEDGVSVIQQIAPPIALESNVCCMAYAANVLEHMIDMTHAQDFLQELSRVTIPGGLVCLKVPDYLSWGREFWNADYTHNFVTTERRVTQMYINNGLDILKVYHSSGIFTGLFGRLASFFARLFPYKFMDWLLKPIVTQGRMYKAKTTFLGVIIIVGRKL